MSKSALLVFKKFYSIKRSKEKNYYFCKTKKNIINYITRESASYRHDLNEVYFNQELANGKVYSEILNNGLKANENDNSGLFWILAKNKFKNIDNKDAIKIMQNLEEEQIVWDMELSFESTFLEKHKIFSQNNFMEVVSEYFPDFLKRQGLEIEKVNLFASVHVNTKNPHIHLVFAEKEKTRLVKNKQTNEFELRWRQQGKIKFDEIRSFGKYLETKMNEKNNKEIIYKQKKDIWDIKNDYRLIYKNDFKNILKLDLARDNLKILKQIASKKNKSYVRLDESEKKFIDQLTQELTKNSSELEELKNLFFKKIDQLLVSEEEKQLFLNKEIDSLNNQIANFTIKELSNEYWELQKNNNSLNHLTHLKHLQMQNNNFSSENFIKKQKHKLPYHIYKIKNSWEKGFNTTSTLFERN
ncbi:relaxase MobL [Mesomycoplasma molare]|uniref:Relaxase MobL n=1 Tax=Mesomycoplasma molare TaxID=171288 RepID=A0ABY5TWY5_9BACT|nr:relaxase MobL [Mesomycoplasma molare]UWD34501.1 relaxase MobL [Mesomycoplasma molare]